MTLAVWLWCRHSRLAGSDDLERWGRNAVTAVQGAYKEHMLKPLLAVRDELFQTFRQVPILSLLFVCLASE